MAIDKTKPAPKKEAPAVAKAKKPDPKAHKVPIGTPVNQTSN